MSNKEFDKVFVMIKELMNRIEALEKGVSDIKYLSSFVKEPEKPREIKESEKEQ